MKASSKIFVQIILFAVFACQAGFCFSHGITGVGSVFSTLALMVVVVFMRTRRILSTQKDDYGLHSH